MSNKATIWFWRDWESDVTLKACSLAAQGLWMRMLCIAAQHDPTGYVSVNRVGLDPEGIARIAGAAVDEVRSLIGELSLNGVFSRDQHGVIYNRRMVADARKSATARRNGKLGGNPTLCKNEGNGPSDKGSLKSQHKARDKLKPIPLKEEYLDKDPTLLPKVENSRNNSPKCLSAEEISSMFERFWVAYGHKIAKPKAFKAFVKALKISNIEDILAGVDQYHKNRPSWQAIQGPEAWLNGERWLDQPARTGPNGHVVHLPENLTASSTIFIEEDTPQWNAWAEFWKKTKGVSPPVVSHLETHERGWRFPTEWPPNGN